jgi:hypothetical protein
MVDKIIIQESPGLLKVTKELLDSNREVVKQVTEANKSTLAKSFADNAAEILSDQLGQKKDAKRDKDAQKLSQKMAANVRNLDTTAKGIKYDTMGKAQKPAPSDTSFGQDAKIERENVAYRAETLEAMDKQNDSSDMMVKLGKSEREVKEKRLKAAEELAQQGEVNKSFLGSLVQGFTGIKSALTVMATIAKEKKKLKEMFSFSRFKKLLPKILKPIEFFKNKNMKAIVGGLLGKTLGMFKVFNKKNTMAVLKGIKGGFNTLKSALGGVFGPFKRILQAIGAVLLLGGLFAFFNSDTWKKMKPNIAKFIGEALQKTEKALTFLGSFLTDNLNPAMGFFLTAIKAVTDFLIEYLIPGMDKGEGNAIEAMQDVREELGQNATEAEVQAEFKKRTVKAREDYIDSYAGFGSQTLMGMGDEEFAAYKESLGRDFDFNQGSGYRTYNPLTRQAEDGFTDKFTYLKEAKSGGGSVTVNNVTSNKTDGDVVLNSDGTAFEGASYHSYINNQK